MRGRDKTPQGYAEYVLAQHRALGGIEGRQAAIHDVQNTMAALNILWVNMTPCPKQVYNQMDYFNTVLTILTT